MTGTTGISSASIPVGSGAPSPPARRPSHFVGGNGTASDSGSRSVRSHLGSNLRHEAAGLHDLHHLRREGTQTVDAPARGVDFTFPHVAPHPVPGVDLSPHARAFQRRHAK